MKEVVTASILLLISFIMFALSFRSYKEKGFLLNNAYLYASEKERATMNKKPYYRQSAIVFLLVGFAFLLNALATFYSAAWVSYVAVAVIIITLVYAILSSIVIEKKKQGEDDLNKSGD